eukprot:5810599-Amphidinium_carterae.1
MGLSGGPIDEDVVVWELFADQARMQDLAAARQRKELEARARQERKELEAAMEASRARTRQGAGSSSIPCHVLDYCSKRMPRITRSTFAAELQGVIAEVDNGIALSMTYETILSGTELVAARRCWYHVKS